MSYSEIFKNSLKFQSYTFLLFLKLMEDQSHFLRIFTERCWQCYQNTGILFNRFGGIQLSFLNKVFYGLEYICMYVFHSVHIKQMSYVLCICKQYIVKGGGEIAL